METISFLPAKKRVGIVLTSFVSGLGMWIVGGLYHNLLLPSMNGSIHPHHEGLGITLIAYLLLALSMTYLYTIIDGRQDSVTKGLIIGFLIGFVWVFPHGLTMAAVHQSSIAYELSNGLYHLIEQGIGGLIMYGMFRTFKSFGKH